MLGGVGERYLVDKYTAAYALGREYGRSVSPTLPGVWATRFPDQVHRYGRSGRRTLYDVVELLALAAKQWGTPLDSVRRSCNTS